MFQKNRSPNKSLRRAAGFGVLTGAAYGEVFAYADELVALELQGEWFFIIPIGIALLFSFLHGNFTAAFWDALGVKPRQPKQ